MKPITQCVCGVLLLAMTGCSDLVEDINGGTGSIELTLDVDASLSTRGGDSSSLIPVPPANDFAVTLTDESGDYSHTWPTLDRFPHYEQYRTGTYTISATYGSLDQEGFESPCFTGSSQITVTEAATARVVLSCTLANTMVSIDYTEAFQKYFKDYSAELHSAAGAYISYPAGESRPVFMRPGDISLTLSLTMPDGTKTTFQPAAIAASKPRRHYKLHLDYNGGNVGAGNITVTIDDSMEQREVNVDLSADLIAAPAPVVTPVGFTPGTTLTNPEGAKPATVAMDINARNGLQSVILTTRSAALAAKGWPAEVDLMAADAATRQLLADAGLDASTLWRNPEGMAVVDFTGVIERLSYVAGNASSSFTIVAKDRLTKVNEPVTLTVDTEPVDLTVVSVSPAVVGINRARLKVSCPGSNPARNIAVEMQTAAGAWTPLAVAAVTAIEPGLWNVDVDVPQGLETINARISWCGNLKATASIPRRSPEYSVEVDPFATRARVKIIAREEAVAAMVTDYVKIFINGSRSSVLERDPVNGLLEVIGLTPATAYTLKATIMDNPQPSDFTEALEFRTEAAAALPNADFEDVRRTIDYNNLASGGYYSQTIVEIFNRLNHQSFKVDTPRGSWANTNAKTFCTEAANPNTWYMQPSVAATTDAYSGGYAVTLTSVGFDPGGAAIPPYAQEKQPFTDYSGNIPAIRYRAAGKLFLGSYAFDPRTMGETIAQGINFSSRPLALNGFYKFAPCAAAPGGQGLVEIIVIGYDNGKEVTIASGRALMSLALSYTAFSIPLAYTHFGIKATQLRVMVSSSSGIGSIADESASIVTVSDARRAAATGSRLTIDNLSLAY